MNKKKVKTGIVGSGFAASFHYEALLKVYGTEIEVTGVYSPTPAKRDTFAKRGVSGSLINSTRSSINPM